MKHKNPQPVVVKRKREIMKGELDEENKDGVPGFS